MSALEEYLIYLRKSRKDRELELQTGDYDTLERHRRTLLDLAKRRGYLIAHIYEEVVSGEILFARPQMLRLLEAVLLLVLVLVSVHGFSSFVCWLEQLFERFPLGGYVRVH